MTGLILIQDINLIHDDCVSYMSYLLMWIIFIFFSGWVFFIKVEGYLTLKLLNCTPISSTFFIVFTSSSFHALVHAGQPSHIHFLVMVIHICKYSLESFHRLQLFQSLVVFVLNKVVITLSTGHLFLFLYFSKLKFMPMLLSKLLFIFTIERSTFLPSTHYLLFLIKSNFVDNR